LITKYVKFDYYRTVVRPKGSPATVPDSPFDIRPFLSRVGSKPLPERAMAYKQEKARMESYAYDSNTGFWDIYFGRLRDFNQPYLAREDGPSEPIDLDDDEYIGENVSAIYDEDHHILMLQRNRYSLGPSAIEEYLNYFHSDGNEEIFLRPIRLTDPRGKVNSAAFHRKFRIKFADLDKKTTEGRGASLSKWMSLFQEYESVTGEVIISVGRQKKATLGGSLRDFVNELHENKDVVVGAEMTIRKSELSEVEVVDLFEEHAHDIIPFTVPPRTVLNHEAVVYQMAQTYEKRKAEIIHNLYL
jgi:hypothetical protein